MAIDAVGDCGHHRPEPQREPPERLRGRPPALVRFPPIPRPRPCWIVSSRLRNTRPPLGGGPAAQRLGPWERCPVCFVVRYDVPALLDSGTSYRVEWWRCAPWWRARV